MRVEDYLSQIEKYDKRINNKLVELYQVRQLAESISIASDGERVKTSLDPDKMSLAVAKIIELEEKINNMVDDYIDLKNKIIQQIEGMDELSHYDVLFKTYIEHKKQDDIANEMNYSVRQVRNILSDARRKFAEKYNIA